MQATRGHVPLFHLLGAGGHLLGIATKALIDVATRGIESILHRQYAVTTVGAGILDEDIATKGLDEVHHLAFVNGAKFFYSQPDLVLDVGVRGMITFGADPLPFA
jgi:hypothetical protein